MNSERISESWGPPSREREEGGGSDVGNGGRFSIRILQKNATSSGKKATRLEKGNSEGGEKDLIGKRRRKGERELVRKSIKIGSS